ncbi:flavin reductase [Fusobacterium ulcerans]|nr:flavin reductase [Fusobacterium ulcerans]
MMAFHEIKPIELNENTFKLFAKDWFLMTAEKEGKVNTMTVGWGGFGVLWKKNVVFVAVRPERYTYEFLEASDTFSLTVFDNSYRKQLGYCGVISGRDEDKIAKCGFTVVHDEETPYFEEARMSFTCRKLCTTPLRQEDFRGNDTFTGKWYGGKNSASGEGGGYHLIYIAEIEKILVKD